MIKAPLLLPFAIKKHHQGRVKGKRGPQTSLDISSPRGTEKNNGKKKPDFYSKILPANLGRLHRHDGFQYGKIT